MYSAAAFPMWRRKKKGHYFTAGIVVGVNPWSVHYNEKFFDANLPYCKQQRQYTYLCRLEH